MATETTIAGVELSHPGRVLFPGQGLTKEELARYYVDVADWLMPHVVGRPLSLVRCPQGHGAHCFYQKHLSESMPAEVHGVEIDEKSGRAGTYLVVHDLAGAVALAQLGALELHPWGARADRVDRPDRLIFDLDPAPDVAWGAVIAAARTLHDRLDALGLASFVKTSGGKGLHVVVPIDRWSDWEEARSFTRALARAVVDAAPDRYVATMSKTKRGGKIYIDCLRNTRGATSVAAYSPRAKEGAPVSTPVSWSELDGLEGAAEYRVGNIRRRLGGLACDPWEGFFEVRQSITAQARKAVGLE